MVLALLLISCPILFGIFVPMFTRPTRPAKGLALCLAAVAALSCTTAHAGTKPWTSTAVAVSSEDSLLSAATPVISAASGTYPGPQTVTISDTTAGATIFYTTDGSYPTTSSAQYTGPITVSSSETVAANAIAYGFNQSAIASAQYVIASSSTSFIYTIAGNEVNGYSGDGGPATVASLNQPGSVVVDAAGNLYIGDSYNNVIRKVAAGTGVITTFAGTGISGYSGDNGPATGAQLNDPRGLSLDSAGDLYFSDRGNSVIRVIAAATGTITTVTGTWPGASGGATNVGVYSGGTAVDSSGNLYIADPLNNQIIEVAAKTGIVSTVAGNYVTDYADSAGYSGDGGPAIYAKLFEPQAVIVDTAGNLYIADSGNRVIREVAAGTGIISTVAGSYGKNSGGLGDGGPATSALLLSPVSVALDKAGNLYIGDGGNNAVREVAASTGIITTVAGDEVQTSCNFFAGDGGSATSATVCSLSGISVDGGGNLYIADVVSRIRLVTPVALPPTSTTAAPIFTVPAGTYASPQTVTMSDVTPGAAIYVTTDGTSPSTLSPIYNGPISVSGTMTIQAVAVAPGYLTSTPASAAYTVTSPPTSVIHTVAGAGVIGFAGAGGPATSAQLGNISAVALDSAGNLFLADPTNSVIWRVSAATGDISIAAGSGTAGYSGDGAPATSAQLNAPEGIAIDNAGNLYISDTSNYVVREVSASTGFVQTIAGTAGQRSSGGQIGDGGPASSAYFSYPEGLAFDGSGNLYIADYSHNEVRMISASSGIITNVAGNGSFAFSGEGGPATSAGLPYPDSLTIDAAGNIYIASPQTGRVWEVVKQTGIVNTVAGNGNLYGSSGDGGPATSAEVYPSGIALDPAGNLYISAGYATIREIAAGTGIITKVIGNGYPGYFGDGGSAAIAELVYPEGIAFDASGNLYIADTFNLRVREVSAPAATATPIISLASGTYTGAQTTTITDSSNGAIIYYTTDGTTPTNTSNVYSDAIAISATTTLQAIAIAPNLAASAVAKATYTIPVPVAPAVTIVTSSAAITTAQTLTVTVTVGGSPTPTGLVTLASGSYSAQQSLANGTATFSVAAGTLPVGTDTLTATYAPDAAGAVNYTTATQTATVNVTQAIGTAAATVTLTPSATTVINVQSVSVAVSVAGGQAAPTGTITLAGTSYTAQQPLASGTTTFTVSAGALTAGSNTLTANYSGDAAYATGSGTTTITVVPVVTSVSTPTPVTPGSSTSATATFSAGSTYSGTMNLSCALTSSPAGAQSLPTCSFSPTSVTLTAGGTASTKLTVSTTAASSSSALVPPGRQDFKIQGWKTWSGGGVVALALLFGVPSWRRRRVIMMVVLFGIAVAGVLGCGGSSSNPPAPNPPASTPATTAGSYTFSVTGTDASNAKISASTNLAITVQ